MRKMSPHTNLHSLYPPSPPCSCKVCTYFCTRPGWWLVDEARMAMDAGYAGRMMLELSQNHSVGVLSPAFKGNEGYFSLQVYSSNGCTFFTHGLCEIFGQTFQPIECRFCHHDRLGYGMKCHQEIARDWNSGKGRRLVRRWLQLQNLQPPQQFVLGT